MVESENPAVSEPSSAENSRGQGSDEDVTNKEAADTSSRRSYECVYCKRGFTNAQALGGHMNIHRKDRANQSLPSSSSSSRQVPVSASNSFVSPRCHSIPDYPAVSAATRSIGPSPSELEMFGNYRPGLETLWTKLSHSSAACPSQIRPTSYFGESYLQVAMSSTSSSMSSDRDEALGSNLSLQVGSSNYREIANEKGDKRMEEVDLELRLGRDP